jgi:hypothetical protein
VRTGLLAVGAAIAIVGAGVVAAVALPFGAAASSTTDRSFQSSVGPDTWKTYNIPAASAGDAAVRFDWNSTHATEVYWYAAGPCVGSASWCLKGGPLASWKGNTTGHWAGFGPPSTGYCVLVDDDNNVSVNFTGEFVESYPAPNHRLPMVPFALVLGGGTMLIGMGGLAMYLGVFLPSGVYRSEPTGSDDADPEGSDPDLSPGPPP